MPNLDAAFSALADPTRRAILARLALGEATVMELAEPFEMTQPAISRHLKVLEGAGLITPPRRRHEAAVPAGAGSRQRDRPMAWRCSGKPCPQITTGSTTFWPP